MIDLGATWTIARAEMRQTRRLARFWIFAALSWLLMLAAYAYYGLMHYFLSNLSQTIAWTNPRFFVSGVGFWVSFALIAGAVFLGFEVRARDTRERIAEVLDARPVSNLELLFGRFLGILLPLWFAVFLSLALVLILGAMLSTWVQPHSLVVLAFLMVSTNALLRIITVPTRFLGITILTLSFVGVYSLRNSVTDCAVAAGFGVFGVILRRLDLPIVPIVLGMVLGGIMETKLRTAMARVKEPLDFIDRPVAAILFAAIVLVIALAVRTAIRDARKPA